MMPISTLSKLFTTGSTATAARAVSSAANELGAVQSAGLGSGTSGTGAMPTVHASGQAPMPPMMPVANLAGRDGSATPGRFELRSTVIPYLAGGRETGTAVRGPRHSPPRVDQPNSG